MGTKKWIAVYHIKLKKKKTLNCYVKSTMLGISLVLSHLISMKTYTRVYLIPKAIIFTTPYAFPD